MTRARARLLAALVASLPVALAPTVSRAQEVPAAIERGIALYHGLAFADAVEVIRRAMADPAAARLADSAQARALTYIGAAEVHLGRIPGGELAFREALARAPHYRIDTLEFPPAVSRVFEDARRRTAFVVARAARDTTVRVGEGSVRFRLAASAPHAVQVAICNDVGAVVRRLYQGPIAESLFVDWDGLDGAGTAPMPGAPGLCVESVGHDGIARRLFLPLRVTLIAARAEDPPVRPSPRPAGWRLVAALGTAGVAAVLPQVVAGDHAPASARPLAVGSAIVAVALASRWRSTRLEPRPSGFGPATYPRGAATLRIETLREGARSEEP